MSKIICNLKTIAFRELHINVLFSYFWVALTLLDLSAAFDTVDHNILFNCLKNWFGVDGTVLRWIKSYLSNHRQKVKIGNSFSDAFSLPYRAPQGSVLGPLLFTLYTTPLSNIISSFNVTHHLYADDTQIYLAVDGWCEIETQTEFVIIGDRQARESVIQKFPTQNSWKFCLPYQYRQEPRCYF